VALGRLSQARARRAGWIVAIPEAETADGTLPSVRRPLPGRAAGNALQTEAAVGLVFAVAIHLVFVAGDVGDSTFR
jgi:hypothetical protein